MWNLFRAKTPEQRVEELVQQAIRNTISIGDIKPIPEDIKILKETVEKQKRLGIFNTKESKEYDWWHRSNYVSKDDLEEVETYKKALSYFKSKCDVDVITKDEFLRIAYNNSYRRGDFLVENYPKESIPKSILDKIDKSEIMKGYIPYTSIRNIQAAYSFIIHNKTIIAAFVPIDFSGISLYAVVFP